MGKIDSETLKAEAQEINAILSDYIKLHDAFTRSSNSLLSIFKPINFNELSQSAFFLLEKLEVKGKELEALGSKEMSMRESEFYQCLCAYTKALKNTLYLLYILFDALEKKAKGGKLSFQEHRKNSEKYKDSIEKYMSLGQELNELYYSL